MPTLEPSTDDSGGDGETVTGVKTYTVTRTYAVTRKDRQRSLARMLSNTDNVKIGLTGGQKRALAAKAAREATAT